MSAVFSSGTILRVKNKFMSVLLGSVFDVKDIICYVVGCLLISLYEIVRFGSVYEQ